MAKQKEAEAGSGGDSGKLCAFLAYLLIGIIWYFADEKMKKNEFVKFHVKQGLVLLITSIIINIIGSIVPVVGWFVILPLGALFILVLWIIGIINALNGKMNPLPVIGGFAKKFTF
jgi:uncharacterized membrane protein